MKNTTYSYFQSSKLEQQSLNKISNKAKTYFRSRNAFRNWKFCLKLYAFSIVPVYFNQILILNVSVPLKMNFKVSNKNIHVQKIVEIIW